MADKQHPPVLERLEVLEEHDQTKREDIKTLKQELAQLRAVVQELKEKLS